MVAESARRVLVLPSMNVMGSIMSFLDLVAYRENERKERDGRGGRELEGDYNYTCHGVNHLHEE